MSEHKIVKEPVPEWFKRTAKNYYETELSEDLKIPFEEFVAFMWYVWTKEMNKQFFESLNQAIKEQLKKAEGSLRVCDQMVEMIERDFSQLHFGKDTALKISNLGRDLNFWCALRDVATERVTGLKEVLALFGTPQGYDAKLAEKEGKQ